MDSAKFGAMFRRLFRLAESAHRVQFVLKGVTLFELGHDSVHGATRDVDLLGFGEPDVDRLQAIFRELCAVEVEPDGLRFLEGSVGRSASATLRNTVASGFVWPPTSMEHRSRSRLTSASGTP